MLQFQIEIDLLEMTEKKFREMTENRTDPYPTLPDFGYSNLLEILECFPSLPVIFTLVRIEKQLDVTPFLKFQKPTLNLPQTEQKELILYLREMIYPTRMTLIGKNVYLRSQTLKQWKDYWINETLIAIIERFNLSFSVNTLDTCQRCGEIWCGDYHICPYCDFPIFGCEYKNATYHHAMQTTCEFCGETHAGCLEHVRAQNQKSCSVRRRKSDTPALPSFDTADSITAETRRLLQYIKRDFKETLEEIHGSIPTLFSFHTLVPEDFLKRYPIVPAMLTLIKEWKLEKAMFSPSFQRSIFQLTPEDKVRFATAVRDATVEDWGAIWADRSVAALIEQMGLPFSVADIDLCERCADVICTGAIELCLGRGGCPNGCGQLIYACDTSHRILTCENPACQRVNKVYRQCVGHTCIT